MSIQADWAISHVGRKVDSDKIPFFRTHQVFAGLLGNAPIDISRDNMITIYDAQIN